MQRPLSPARGDTIHHLHRRFSLASLEYLESCKGQCTGNPLFFMGKCMVSLNQSSEGLFPFPPKGPSNYAYTWLCLVGESNRFHDSNTLRAPNCGAYPRVERQTPPANSTQAAPCSVRKVASDSETALVLPLSVSKHGKAFQSRFKSQKLLK